ncbi:hypothetical protein GF354_03580 [Candidatus Peregrinibacteria bacterium]|nr:hypothetical protein [Candidatus Peregrinibacteria bacterium]
MLEILIATGNPGKFNEIAEMLNDLPLRLRSLGEFNVDTAGLKEDGSTYKKNAFVKAKYFFDRLDMPCLGEDSGIQVDAFKHELGVKTRRWGAGEEASDEEWVDYFLKKMLDVPDARRGARFICSACFLAGDKEEYFEGETPGIISRSLEAPIKKGIPLSSCFRPSGMENVYAALSNEEKNKISHRGKAMKNLRDYIIEAYGL